MANDGNNSNKIDSVSETINKVVKAVDDFNKVARGVQGMTNLIKLVSSFADPDAYDPGDIPGSTTHVEELVPDEYTDPALNHNIRFNVSSLSDVQAANNRILAVDYAITIGDSVAYDQIVDKTYQDLERASNYTNPFSRLELSQYIEKCKHAMLIMCKLLAAAALSNSFEVGDTNYMYKAYTIWFGDGTYVPSVSLVRSDLLASRPALLEVTAQFAGFMKDKIYYDAPIMSEIFVKNTLLFADSTQDGANVVGFNGLHNCEDTAATYDIYTNMISTSYAGVPYFSVAQLIAAAQTFMSVWTQTDSRIASKMKKWAIARSIDIPYEKWTNGKLPIVYHPEINAQLRNGILLSGYSNHADNSGTAMGLGAASLGVTNPYGSGGEPLFAIPTQLTSQDASAVTYTRIGKGNHLTKFTISDVANTTKYVPYVGVVSTEDYEFDSKKKIASALAFVPLIAAFKMSGVSNKIAFAAYSPELLLRARFTDVNTDNGSVRVKDVYPTYNVHGNAATLSNFAGDCAVASARASVGSNWLNCPIFDCVIHANTADTKTILEDTTNIKGMIMSNTMYEKIFQISADELRSNKRVSTYSLHRTPGIRKGTNNVKE